MIRTLLIALSTLVFCSSVVAADPPGDAVDKPVAPVAWDKIPSAEQKVLAPLKKDWSQLLGAQQRRLIGAAKEYPKLTAVEQARFQTRLNDWVGLSPEQRKAARENHRDFSSLPPDKQVELRQRWQQSQAEKNAAAAATAAPK